MLEPEPISSPQSRLPQFVVARLQRVALVYYVEQSCCRPRPMSGCGKVDEYLLSSSSCYCVSATASIHRIIVLSVSRIICAADSTICIHCLYVLDSDVAAVP